MNDVGLFSTYPPPKIIQKPITHIFFRCRSSIELLPSTENHFHEAIGLRFINITIRNFTAHKSISSKARSRIQAQKLKKKSRTQRLHSDISSSLTVKKRGNL